ncbi:hypothetical protein UFOVP1229_140 [uncultured Caudovirales phage]|uniref:Uncharacterized protein n=1 Tax=uncultured Caudovirales phage TaxID=2100421 RepID=A0A6J5RDM4_9CAUD|nr:hypothetical protein UFOVP1229_140 [uncultured Caudovirales phage]
MLMQDVSGMPEHYLPILNESGNKIMNGHLSEGMTVTIPDPFFGGTVIGTIDEGSVFGKNATATSGGICFCLELDPVRGIWVSSNIAMSVSAIERAGVL